jgi:LDH2 family malate/lactate/ureidoglycolate dehydrogenase
LTTKTYAYETLDAFVQAVLAAKGYTTAKAEKAAKNLLKADLRGIDSHGIARLSGYLRQMDYDVIKPDAQPTITHETPSTANLNADQELGLLAGQEGMRLAIDKARQVGCGFVTVHNSTHFGIAAAHAELALHEDMIGMASTNATPIVAPAGGVTPKLGTNPFCWAIPAGDEPPFIADMATTTVANGKLEIATRKEQAIPTGWAQTADGQPSSDPYVVEQGGTLVSLGSDAARGRHKGYALASVADILSGVLGGANFGPWVPPFVPYVEAKAEATGEGIGHFLGVWRVDAFRETSAFKAGMDQWINSMRNTTPGPEGEPVQIPGDPERQTEEARRQHGITLNDKVYRDLLSIQQRFGLHII